MRKFYSMMTLFVMASFVCLLGVACSPVPNDEKADETAGETVKTSDASTTEQSGTETSTQTEPATEPGKPDAAAETTPEAVAETTPEPAPDATGGALSYATHIVPIMQKASCLSSYCHGGKTESGGLNMTYANLVGTKSKSGAWTRVVAGDPDKSLLYEKLSKEKPAEGARMPIGSQLTSAQIKMFKDWITEGAKP